MIKTVFKEIIIILLLCLAILLILSVLFYDYNPISKVVPNKIAYTVPENIKNDLEEENTIEEITVENKVYTIEGSDLNIYKKSKSYNPGKANPFSTTTEDDTNTVENTNGNAGTTPVTNTNSINNTNSAENSTNSNENTAENTNNTTFWNTTGRK